MKTRDIPIRTQCVLLVATLLISGCVMPAAAPGDSSGAVTGQTRSIILVPVLILPPSDGDQTGKEPGPALKHLPPAQSIRDQQTRASVNL